MNMTNPELQILLVEDSPADAEFTIDALREIHLDNRVHWAKDGAEALEKLFAGGSAAAEGQRVGLVLLDLRMPKVDGLEVLRAVRADERTRHLPVVVLTSSHEDIDLVRAYDLGVNSYVVKPVEADAFMQAVRDLGRYWMLLNRLPDASSAEHQ